MHSGSWIDGHPGPEKLGEVRFMADGNPGGKPAFTPALAPISRTGNGESRQVWRGYLAATANGAKGRLEYLGIGVKPIANPP